jgi:hypothetical protein
MEVRRSILVLVVLFAPLAAMAEDHKWGTYAALSHTKNGGTNPGVTSVWNGGLSAGRTPIPENSGLGWHVAADVTLSLPWFKDNVAFVGDASGHLIGEDEKWDATQITVMVGPRFGIPMPEKSAFHFFGHVMAFGAIHRSDSRLDVNTSALAIALGGGMDFLPFNDGHDGFRLQIDRIFVPAENVDGSVRTSFGYVHRFK